MDKIPSPFTTHAANVLGDTENGLSAREIVRYCTDYAVDFDGKVGLKNLQIC